MISAGSPSQVLVVVAHLLWQELCWVQRPPSGRVSLENFVIQFSLLKCLRQELPQKEMYLAQVSVGG